MHLNGLVESCISGFLAVVEAQNTERPRTPHRLTSQTKSPEAELTPKYSLAMEPTLVLQVNASHAERARDRCLELCSEVELVRCGTNRKAVHLVLLNDAGSSANELQLRVQQDDACMRCVTRYYPVDHTAADTAEVIASVGAVSELSADSILRVRAVPKQLEKTLADGLTETGLTLRPQGFTHMVFVAQAGGKTYWAVRPAEPVEDLSHFQKPPDAVCRAQHKLEEACLRAGIELQQQMVALDVGAAPGGWSSYLANHVQHVVAVDPAVMNPDAEVAAKIDHLQMMAQQAVEVLISRDTKFDLLVCDVNEAPGLALDEMILPVMVLMKPGAWIVFTLKNCTQHKVGAGRPASEWSGQVKEVHDKLTGHCDNFQLIHLMANTCHETTLVCKKMN